MIFINNINDFYEKIKENKDAQKAAKEKSEIERKKELITLRKGEDLPIYPTQLILQKNEICHYECSAKRYITEITKKNVEGHGGVSIRIAKGFSFHIGRSKSHTNKKVDEVRYLGKLFITNKRIIFTGQNKNFTVTYSNLIAIKPHKDGFGLQAKNISYGIIINNIYNSEEVNAILNGVFSNMLL